MKSKTTQKAGDNSKQLQVDVVNINNGIDEKRVREIVDEKMQLELINFSQEALKVAQDRINKFSNVLIPKMAQNRALSAFADPAFQLLLTEAQKSAATTARQLDYDMLSELMLDRFNKSSSSNTVIGISRAVEIINQVSDEALLGLTIFNAVERFLPQSGNMAHGLKVLDDFYDKLLSGDTPLPTSTDWLDHLDILNAARISLNNLSGTKQLGDFWYEKFDGYVSYGIKKGSEELASAREELLKVGLDQNLLIDNERDKDYKRLPVVRKHSIDSLTLNRLVVDPDGEVTYKITPVTKNEIEALKTVYDKYDAAAKLDKDTFIVELDKHHNLKTLREWWDTFSGHSIELTVVGRVLAYANAQRAEPKLPKLDV